MKTTIVEKADNIAQMNKKLLAMITEHEGTKLEVTHDLQPENEVQVDNGEGFCYHDCTSVCRHNGCNCECGEWHIPKN